MEPAVGRMPESTRRAGAWRSTHPSNGLVTDRIEIDTAVLCGAGPNYSARGRQADQCSRLPFPRGQSPEGDDRSTTVVGSRPQSPPSRPHRSRSEALLDLDAVSEWLRNHQAGWRRAHQRSRARSEALRMDDRIRTPMVRRRHVAIDAVSPRVACTECIWAGASLQHRNCHVSRRA